MRRLLAALGLWVAAGPAGAVVDGELDDFGASVEQWQRGALALGGPAHPADPFLLLTSGAGSNPRLVTYNQSQWSGDYVAAGVDQIALWLNNLGATSLSVRLAFGDNFAPGPTGTSGNWYATTQVAALPAGSGWTPVVFDIGPADLQLVVGTQSYATVMSSVVSLRILHATAPSARGTPVTATLGVDRIVAVPEPGATAAGAAALCALALVSRSRRARPA